MARKKSQDDVSDEVQIAVMANDISYIKKAIDDLNRNLQKNYVSKTEFDPVKKVVFGLVGMTLVAVLGAIMGFIFMK